MQYLDGYDIIFLSISEKTRFLCVSAEKSFSFQEGKIVVIRILILLLLISILIPFIVSHRTRIGVELPLEVLAPEVSIPEVSIKEVIPESEIQEEIAIQDILRKMKEAYEKVEDYQCICITHQLSRFGKKMHKPKVLRLSFKRPGMMHAIGLQGVEKGAEAVFRNGKVKGTHHRYVPFIVFTFDADSRMARSPRHGLRLDECNLGGLIERANRYNREGKIELAGIEEIEGRECYRLVMIPEKMEGKHPITKEILWVDKEKFLSIQHAIYEKGNRFAESRTFKDLKINIGLSDELFEPPKARWWRKKR